MCAWRHHSIRGAFGALLAFILVSAGQGTGQTITPEYQLKAAFVSKFPEFTEWPSAAVETRPTIDICVARPNPFGSTLAEFIAGTELRGRSMRVRDVSTPVELDTCHLLFVPSRAPDRKALLARSHALPVLTIGESPSFLDEGGIVNLRLVDGRVRFEIDVGASSRVGVRLSSQLLRLALNVRGGPA